MAGSLLGGEAAHTQSPITATRCGGGSFTDAHLPRADKLYYGSYVGTSILRSFGDSGWDGGRAVDDVINRSVA